MLLSPNEILPSQDFLKERTVRFIFDCLRTGRLNELPPAPLVRKDATGRYIAIDGHNLIAVLYVLGKSVDVFIAGSAHDGLPETTDEERMRNTDRNKELVEKYDGILEEQRLVAAKGINSFDDLTKQYQSLFDELATSA